MDLSRLEGFIRKYDPLIRKLASQFVKPGYCDFQDCVSVLRVTVVEVFDLFEGWGRPNVPDHEIANLFRKKGIENLYDLIRRSIAQKRDVRITDQLNVVEKEDEEYHLVDHSKYIKDRGASPEEQVIYKEQVRLILDALENDPIAYDFFLEKMNPLGNLRLTNYQEWEAEKKVSEAIRDIVLTPPYIYPAEMASRSMQSLVEHVLALDYDPSITFEKLFCSLSRDAAVVLAFLVHPETPTHIKGFKVIQDYFGKSREWAMRAVDEIRHSYIANAPPMFELLYLNHGVWMRKVK